MKVLTIRYFHWQKPANATGTGANIGVF